jgi:hypothetical protein
MDIKAIPASQAKRPYITEFHDAKIRFPLPHRAQRTNDTKYASKFRAARSNTVW